MRRQNESLSDRGNDSTGSEEKALLMDAPLPKCHSTAELAEKQYRNCDGFQISDILRHGAANAIPARELLKIGSFTSRRAFNRQVQRERDSGSVILANGAGYFLPSRDPQQARREIQAWAFTMSAKSASIQKSLRAARSILRQCDGQQEIDL